jgi:predicted metal-dependent hydrolase
MFGKQKILYDIVHSKKRKKIELIVLENEKVKVLAPSGKSSDQIHQLVKSNSQWIFQQQLRLREHKDKKLITYCDGSTLLYLGRQYQLRIIDGQNSIPESFSFDRGKFIVKAKCKEPKVIKALYEKWLENRAVSILEKKVNEYSDVLKIDYN